MSIRVQCGNCGQRYKVSDNAAGRVILCQKCQTSIPIPHADEMMPPPVASVGGDSSVTSRSGDSVISLGGDSSVTSPAGGSSVTSPTGGSSVTSPSSIASSAVSRSGGSKITSSGAKAPNPAEVVRPDPPNPAAVIPPAPPVAQPISGSRSNPVIPIAHPVEDAVVESGVPDHSHAAGPGLDDVGSDAMEEMLDEQERAERDRFRGLRRSLRNPPSVEEMVAFVLEHKLFTTVTALAVLAIVEFLRERDIVMALVFGVLGIGLSIAGLRSTFGPSVLYQASAWCYLVVLCVFPILRANKEGLGLAGVKVLQNPTRIVNPPTIAQALPEAAPPPPAISPEPDDTAIAETAPATEVDGETEEAEKPTAREASTIEAPQNTVRDTDLSEPRPVAVEQPFQQSLRQRADRAFSDADPRAGFGYLHADAVARDDSDVWRFMRWNGVLNRPAIGTRWGMGVDFNNLAIQWMGIQIGQNPGGIILEGQKHMAAAFHKQTSPLGVLVSIRLCDCYDEGLLGDPELIPAPRERGLRGTWYLGADTPAELQRAARAQDLDFLFVFSVRATPTAAQPKFTTGIRIVDVANGVDLYPRPKQKPLALRKDLDAALDYLENELRLGEIPKSIDPAAIQERLKAATSKKPGNPLALLMELRWYQREKHLPPADVEKFMANLVGPADARVLSGGSDAEREKLVLKWLPGHH